jgi:hypothetical protein
VFKLTSNVNAKKIVLEIIVEPSTSFISNQAVKRDNDVYQQAGKCSSL